MGRELRVILIWPLLQPCPILPIAIYHYIAFHPNCLGLLVDVVDLPNELDTGMILRQCDFFYYCISDLLEILK